jgi:DNA-directed RNA polymerase subunit RPC12/RpoP
MSFVCSKCDLSLEILLITDLDKNEVKGKLYICPECTTKIIEWME